MGPAVRSRQAAHPPGRERSRAGPLVGVLRLHATRFPAADHRQRVGGDHEHAKGRVGPGSIDRVEHDVRNLEAAMASQTRAVAGLSG